MRTSFKQKNNGATLIYLLVIIFVFSVIMMPIINLLVLKMRVLGTTIAREQSLQVAEAGINYYQWHLAHFPTDYKDGTTSAGPYVHNYSDYDTQQPIGQYSLTVTPPVVGSTVVTIKSTGWTNANPNIKKTITTTYGVQSLAQYAFLSNDIVWIGEDEAINGQLQSNNGVRFDGTSNSPVKSAKSTYTCEHSQGCSPPTTKPGVWGSASQEVQNFWQFPVPAVDFSSLTSNFSTAKTSAQNAGIYLAPSDEDGYSLVFNGNGTVTIYKATASGSNPTGWNTNGAAYNRGTDYSERTLLYTRNMPANGLIYAEDNVWVEGTVNGRVTVIAAILPYNSTNAPSIFIANNVLYTSKDGSDVLGLIAQKNIVITYSAPDDLEVDAAMVAQNGAIQFYYYPNNIKDSITIYGSIMTFNQWTWTWVSSNSSVVSGYQRTLSIYDSNLFHNPPPSFPVTTSGYQQLSWISD